MKKRILTVLLSAAIAVSALCGCEESRETGGRARTKEEQREESTREDSRENSEDSGETSAEESRETSAVENGETSSEESTDLLTGALGGGEDSIELSVNFTDPNFEAGYSDFEDLYSKDFGEIWSSDDNYVKSYIADDGTEYSLDVRFGDEEFPCGWVVQGMPVKSYPDVFYTVWDFSDESGAIDYDTINEYNLAYAYKARLVFDSNNEYTPDSFGAKYGSTGGPMGEAAELYKRIKSQILKTKKCHMCTVVNDIEKYCDLICEYKYEIFTPGAELFDDLYFWFDQNMVTNKEEVLRNTFNQVINEEQLTDLSFPVVYTFIEDYILNNKIKCRVDTLELPPAEDAYTTEFLEIFNKVYPGEELDYIYSYRLEDGGYVFANERFMSRSEDAYRLDSKLKEAGLTDDTPIFKEGLPTE